MFYHLTIILILSIVAYWSAKRKALTIDGILCAVALGLIVGQYDFGSFLILIAYFMIATQFPKLGARFLKRTVIKHEARSAIQVLANGGICAVLPYIYRNNVLLGSLLISCSLSASLADSMASDIGQYCDEQPVLITNWNRKVPVGTDGGVTFGGSTFGILATFILALCHMLVHQTAFGIALIPIVGVSGMLLDSLLGALFQTGVIASILTNSQVNVLSNLLITVAGAHILNVIRA